MLPSVLERIHPVLRRLRRDRVADAGRGVQPERRRRLAAAAQRDQQVVRDVALREPGLRRARPVDVQVQLRLVERLVHAQVDDARAPAPAVAASAAANRRFASRLRPTTWTSIGAGRPKFRIWLTMSAGMNEKWTPGNCSASSSRRSSDVVRGRPVLLAERDQDVGVAGPDRRRVRVGEVEPAVRQADVVDDAGDLAPRDDRSRIACSTRSQSTAVSSMRVPVGARRCSLNWPLSTAGKKSCPTHGEQANDASTGGQEDARRTPRVAPRQRSSSAR